MATATMNSSQSLLSPSMSYGASYGLTFDKYRGAVIEDLQLPPAFCIPSSEPIATAIEQAYERDFSHIPVLNSKRRPLGYIDVAALKKKWEAGHTDPNDKVLQHMTKFKRGPEEPYTLITPMSPLADLEKFLEDNVFALVTDNDRKFVLGVATPQDLEHFVTRRGLY